MTLPWPSQLELNHKPGRRHDGQQRIGDAIQLSIAADRIRHVPLVATVQHVGDFHEQRDAASRPRHSAVGAYVKACIDGQPQRVAQIGEAKEQRSLAAEQRGSARSAVFCTLDVKAVLPDENVPDRIPRGVPRSHSSRNTSGSDDWLSVSAAPATRAWGWVATRTASWMALDWVLATYVTFVALVAIVWSVPWWPYILAGHAAIVVGLLLLPSRGAAWEHSRAADPRWLFWARSVARFLRYTYPALLLTPFFEEVSLTVNAVAADAPYWFEHYLFNADSTLFGGTPAVMLSQAGNPVLDEIMHAFYFWTFS